MGKGASPVAQVKNPPAKQKTQVWSRGREDPLEKENSNPPQYSHLGNYMGRGVWQPIVHGVTEKSDTT